MSFSIWCHPDNLDLIRAAFPESRPSDGHLPHLSLFSPLMGIPIKTSPHIPKFKRVWVPPSGRFWECEESDRPWCEAIGWGGWRDTDEPVFLKIADRDGAFLSLMTMFVWGPEATT